MKGDILGEIMETGYTVLDAMTHMPITVLHTDSVSKCAQIMAKHRLGSLLILQDDKLSGIVTEGDLIRKVLSKGLDPLQTPVHNVMSKDIISVSPHMDIHEAMLTMNNFDIRHAPVLHEEKLAGFLTLKDILRIQPELFEILAEKNKMQQPANELDIDFDTDNDLDDDEPIIKPYHD